MINILGNVARFGLYTLSTVSTVSTPIGVSTLSTVGTPIAVSTLSTVGTPIAVSTLSTVATPIVIGGVAIYAIAIAASIAIISNSNPGLDKVNKRIKDLEEEKTRTELENQKKQIEWNKEKARIEKIANDKQRKEYEEKLRIQKIANEKKIKEDNERLEKEKQKLLKEKEAEKKNIEKYGWDCEDYPRKSWQDTHVFNIAVTGTSGAGKSTLINSLLDLPRGQRARIGVTECTDVINSLTYEPHRYSQYDDKGIKKMDVFDLPGCGTDKFPVSSYIKNFALRYFSMVIIVVDGRITQADVMLYTELLKFNIPCFVVRNKVDEAVKTNYEENFTSEKETIKEIKDYFKGKGIKDPILISAKERKYEWDLLLQEFKRSLMRMHGNAEYVENDIDNTCEMCCAAWINTSFQDCGHRSICSRCVENLKIKKCLKCSKDIKSIKYD